MGTMDELINSMVVDELRSSLRTVDPTLECSALTRARTAVAGMRLRTRSTSFATRCSRIS